MWAVEVVTVSIPDPEATEATGSDSKFAAASTEAFAMNVQDPPAQVTSPVQLCAAEVISKS